ncbi:MAG: glycosyltransferase family 39 protein [Patescibacteria group bacterium]
MKHALAMLFLVVLYLMVLFQSHKEIFGYKFNSELISRYKLSQDIPHEVPGKRLFLSDSEIHIASGYLYVLGNNPTTFNFQHPPFIKYLYGLSTLLFKNPFIIQIIFGIILLFLTYKTSFLIFNSFLSALFSTFLLLIDPLFIDISSQALLDLGQAVFIMLYFYLLLKRKKINSIFPGIILGILFASKFWTGSLFFVLIFDIYFILKKKLCLKDIAVHLITSFIVFSIIYFKTFLDMKGLFNIIFFELKTIKYWLHHSTASKFGSSIFLFLTGNFKSWWGNKTIIKSEVWSPLWPIVFILTSYRLVILLIKKKFNQEFLVSFIPVVYLIYLGVQAPFDRYFILILPFFYIIFTNLLISKLIFQIIKPENIQLKK